MKSTAKTLFFSVIFFLGTLSGVVAQDYFSFGDAPASYNEGVVPKHKFDADVKLGNLNYPDLQTPVYSIWANVNLNDDGITIPTLANGTTDLAHADFKLNGSDLQAVVNVTNNSGKNGMLIGWIDFNRDGVFQANEASDPISLPNNLISETRILVWAGAASKMRHGVTYMRVRVTTDNMLSNEPTASFSDGEIEDYRLDFDLIEYSKTANNPTVKRNLGDTIEYTLTIKSNISLTNVDIIDPQPTYTEIIPGTITPAVVPGNIIINGETVVALKWENQSINNTEKVFTFKVVVTDIPPNYPAEIYNVGMAVYNGGDTVYSTGVNCDLAPVPVNQILAKNDSVSLIKNVNIKVHILENDIVGTCSSSGLIVGVVSAPTKGTLSAFNSADQSMTYTPTTGAVGVDSTVYYIKCKEDSVVAKVLFLINDPISEEECAEAMATVGYATITDVTYTWEQFTPPSTHTNKGTSNTLIIYRTSPGTEDLYYVYPKWKGNAFPHMTVKMSWPL